MAQEAKVVLHSLTGETLSYGLPSIPCFRCGLCCITALPQLDQGEVEGIAAGLGVRVETVLRDYARPHPHRPGYYLMRWGGEGCVFLLWEGDFTTCRIYPFKPEVCRAYQPSLAKEECQEGLKRLSSSPLLLPGQLFAQPQEVAHFLAQMAGKGEKEL